MDWGKSNSRKTGYNLSEIQQARDDKSKSQGKAVEREKG